MPEGMLGLIPLPKIWGLVQDILAKLAGPDGPTLWWPALKRFLRRENPWEHVLSPAGKQGPPIFDCSAAPFCPDGWTVEEHNTQLGWLCWDPCKIRLHTSSLGDRIQGTPQEVYEEVISRQDLMVLNANALEILLMYPHLIPKEWFDRAHFGSILFWGTVYRDQLGDRRVRCLVLGPGMHWSSVCLSHDTSCLGLRDNPAAVIAA